MREPPAPLLLSRVAEAAYWAGRYLERAESTARLVKAHSDLILDLPRSATVGWQPLLAVMGETRRADAPQSLLGEEQVVRSLTADANSASSIRSSVDAVHANLRVVRAVMPVEAAEILNELRLHVEQNPEAAISRRTRSAWLATVVRGCQTLSGVLAETVSHDEAYLFLTIGRQIERADMVTRVLDVHARVLVHSSDDSSANPYEDLYWAATLRSLSAIQVVRRRGVASSRSATVAFLLQDPKSPRTIEACLVETSRWLLEIPRHDDAMAECAAVASMLRDVDSDRLDEKAVHELTGTIQAALGRIHDRIEATWFSRAHEVIAS